MRNRNYKPYYRHPKTTQERRAHQGWRVRAKRTNLPTVYDDICVHHEKSWKSRRKKQYRPEARSKRIKRVIKLESHPYGHELIDELVRQDIAYRIEYVCESEKRWNPYYKEYRKFSRVIGYKLTYWR